MANKDLEKLLIEYEQKRRRAQMQFEQKKEEVYKNIPEIKQIEEKIQKKALNKAKQILNNETVDIENLEEEIQQLKQKKEKILKEKNITLKINYECEICQDTGYVFEEKTKMCNCLKQKLLNISYNKSNLSNLQKENFSNFDESIFSSKVDIEKYKLNISPLENINNIRNASMDFVKNFEKIECKNLLFSGNTGLGKTYMSNCIANEVLKMGKTVLYQTAPVLLETVIDNKFNKYKTADTNNFYNNVLEADLLIIDDLGTECLNSMKNSELFTILNTRALNLNNKITKTIISTNLSIEKIFGLYGERIGSRIAGYYDIYYFFGDDLRFKR